MRLGVIGGTGLVNLDLRQQLGDSGMLLRQDDVEVETAFGPVPLRLCTVQIGQDEHEVVFLQRHHNDTGHGRPPHMINHKANLSAMLGANVEAVLSVCSVGAIASTFPTGKVALADQYIDLTGVSTTFHDAEATFTSATVPFSPSLNERLEGILRTQQPEFADGPFRYTYWLTQGPQFETVAEVDAIERLGGDMVGMTMPRRPSLRWNLTFPTLPFAFHRTGQQAETPLTAKKRLTISTCPHRPTTASAPSGPASRACSRDTNMMDGRR